MNRSDFLRTDLIERARKMTYARSNKHPWLSMSDEELLRSAGLILMDNNRQIEGITLAAILLFGKDTTIMSALPQHKTDMIFRVYNEDRYDDRDVIITNLLETFDRMDEFAKKHLNDPFVLDGPQSISVRDAILREIISNSLAHRDYSSGFVARMVIEKNRIFVENSNRSHGHGSLNPSTCQRTRLYSGGVPEFLEGDVFTTIIPLSDESTKKVGPNDLTFISDQVSDQVKPERI